MCAKLQLRSTLGAGAGDSLNVPQRPVFFTNRILSWVSIELVVDSCDIRLAVPVVNQF